jgi:N-acetylmuramoyl-L-alanine amidase
MRIWRTLAAIVPLLTFVFPIECHGRGAAMSLEKVATSNGLRMLSPSSFVAPTGTFQFGKNTRAFTFNGTSMPLGFPISTRLGKVCVDESDYRHHLKPLFAPVKLNCGNPPVIAIDAGHGGGDGGTISPTTGAKEKDLNLDIALRVAKILESNGYRTTLTRGADGNVPLEERTRIANRSGADVFIAIHFNSSPNRSASGIETFTLTPTGQPSTYATRSVSMKFPGNDFDGANTLLGHCLQSSLVAAVRAVDRGVRHSTFVVLRGLRCPGALVECGFLSNAPESVEIGSTVHRERLARAIAAGVTKFIAAVSR